MTSQKNSVNLCQPGFVSCFGCCGHSYKSRKDVKKGIDDNTAEFREFESRMDFMNRSETLRDCGICRNLVFEDGMVFCPLHPVKNGGFDLRIGHCDVDYECMTKKTFRTWDKARQDDFIRFIRSKNLDWYDYSIRMDNDSLLAEFLAVSEK